MKLIFLKLLKETFEKKGIEPLQLESKSYYAPYITFQ